MIGNYKEFKNILNEEVGFRKIKQLSKKYDFAEIFFHKDLDGVCSCLAMKYFLKTYYNISLSDTHYIQYGGEEFAIKNTIPGNLPIIVDFAHSKVGYLLFDHHDKQSGSETSAGVYAKPSRSNVETISGEISYSDAFTDTDIELIKAVDSADFLKNDIKPEDIQNAIFNYDKSKSPTRNRFLMGFVVNRLLLALKNKRITVTSLDGKNHHINKNLLECLVLDSSPSLYSIFNNLKHYINTAISLEWDRGERTHQSPKKLITPEELTNNLMKYINTRKEYIEVPGVGTTKHKDIDFDPNYKIVKQYGIGYVMDTGSYDRYVIFKNFPEADFVCTIFPMGLIQVSCNPFKERSLEEINLGEIAKEVLASYKDNLLKINIPLSDIKRLSETEIKKMKSRYGSEYTGVGFKFSDLQSSYKNSILYMPNFKQGDKKTTAKLNLDEDTPVVDFLKKWMDVPFDTWPENIIERLKNLKIPIWDIIIESSGGHKAITNIQGVSYLSCRRDLIKILFKTDNWIDIMKSIADKFIETLKSKIDIAREGKKVEYDTDGIELSSTVIVENVEYFINDQNDIKQVSKEDFISFGMDTNFEPKRDHERGFKINIADNKIIGYYESYKTI